MTGAYKLLNTDCLYGIGTSLGCVQGEVYVVDDASNLNEIPKGKILVTKTTDPGWVFLIKNANKVALIVVIITVDKAMPLIPKGLTKIELNINLRVVYIKLK